MVVVDESRVGSRGLGLSLDRDPHEFENVRWLNSHQNNNKKGRMHAIAALHQSFKVPLLRRSSFRSKERVRKKGESSKKIIDNAGKLKQLCLTFG